MQNELKERTLVAAETAKELGLVHTYEILVTLVKVIVNPDHSLISKNFMEQICEFYP